MQRRSKTQTIFIALIVIYVQTCVIFLRAVYVADSAETLPRDRIHGPPSVSLSTSSTSATTTESAFVPSIQEREGQRRWHQDEPQPAVGGAKECTPEQLEVIKRQLPPEACLEDIKSPWAQRCSFTQETKCPEETWINNHYKGRLLLSSNGDGGGRNGFVGISVGCNKGFDAVDTMRMGSADPVFDKTNWKEAIYGRQDVKPGVCDQDSSRQFEIPPFVTRNGTAARKEMHCIEPMPQNYASLSDAARKLGLDTRGFVVSHAAISKQNGKVLFPSGGHLQAGREQKGISNCENYAGDTKTGRCREVLTYSLDSYAKKFVTGFDKKGEKTRPIINMLSVDVEGYDCDVLLGGEEVLRRTEYVVFEYNWMGSWKRHSLLDTVVMLDGLDFTCYWPGKNKLWRITGCFLDHYEAHHWSNVACVNRKRVPELGKRMEDLFLYTIQT